MTSTPNLRPRILVITPVRHIPGVAEILESAGEVTYLDDPTPQELLAVIPLYDALYTNPNKSRVFIGREVLDAATQLRVVCTASTGTNHIDTAYLAARGLGLLALTEERAVINRVSSTAELAFALTMASLRHVVHSHDAVLRGEWDYLPYVGRQMNGLTIGVIGYGRLGTLYASYCRAFDSRVLAFDPYQQIHDAGVEQVAELADLLTAADVISLHVHVTPETEGMISDQSFARMKDDVVLVNTARGEIVDEVAAVEFLRSHPKSRIATDVLTNEVRGRLASPLLQFARQSKQVIITPHIGGMSREAQQIAYGHAAGLLRTFLSRTPARNP